MTPPGLLRILREFCKDWKVPLYSLEKLTDAALEEAARVAVSSTEGCCDECDTCADLSARAIRALKSAK